MNDITRRAALGAALAVPFVKGGAAQERFPNKPITIYVPFPAGGATDVQMRSFAEAATRHLGQTVLVENRPGAGSTLGAAAVARARPDGYTVSQMTLPALRLPHMQRMPYDVTKDFTPIIHLTGYLFGVVVRADAPWQTWQQFLDDAKANPGKIAYGSPGVGSTLHITMERIAAERGIEFLHVPFRGGADNAQAMLGGQTQAMADSSSWGPLVEGGRARLLARPSVARAVEAARPYRHLFPLGAPDRD
jgi:tripartite-type tricarboxylate transporter receptor subunit TctC